MTSAEKVALIRSRIEAAFTPSHLEIIDESDKHIGHPGHQGGGRHFAVAVAAECLQGKSRVAAHRMVYGLFVDLIPDEVHALRIVIKPWLCEQNK